MDRAENLQRYIDFDNNASTSLDAMVPGIVKEIKEKQAEISSYSERESDLELEQNKPPTKTEAFHCLQTIRNCLTSIYETTDVNYNSLHNIEKRIVGSTSRDKQTLKYQYFMSQ